MNASARQSTKSWFLGEVAFNAFYFTYYKTYGWPSPGIPGGILFGLSFGWGLGWTVVTAAEGIKQMIDRHWPTVYHVSRLA